MEREWDFKRWQEFSSHLDDKEQLDAVLSAFNLEGENILEIGCASGRTTKLLAEKAKKVTGIDPSKIMVEYAKEYVPNVEFLVAKAEELPFGDNSFDIGFSVWCLHEVQDVEKSTNELCRVSKGKIVIMEPTDESVWLDLEKIIKVKLGMKPTPHVPINVWIRILTSLNKNGYKWETKVVSNEEKYVDLDVATKDVAYVMELKEKDYLVIKEILSEYFKNKPINLNGKGIVVVAKK